MAEAAAQSGATENPGVCESCGFMTTAVQNFGALATIPFDNLWLCNLCASTVAGNAVIQPQHYDDIADVLRTVCFVGNTVLAKLEELKEANDGE